VIDDEDARVGHVGGGEATVPERAPRPKATASWDVPARAYGRLGLLPPVDAAVRGAWAEPVAAARIGSEGLDTEARRVRGLVVVVGRRVASLAGDVDGTIRPEPAADLGAHPRVGARDHVDGRRRLQAVLDRVVGVGAEDMIEPSAASGHGEQGG